MKNKNNKVDKQWFQDKIAERGLSQARFAKMQGLDPSQISLLLSGKRKMKLTDIEMFASALGKPVDQVAAKSGLYADSKSKEIAATGWVDDNGRISKLKDVTVKTDLSLPANAVAIQVRSPATILDGAYVFYLKDVYKSPDEVQTLCIVDDQYVGVLKKGYSGEGSYCLLSGSNQQEIEPKKVSPVICVIP